MHHRLRGGLFPLADKKQTPLASLQSLRTAIGIDSHCNRNRFARFLAIRHVDQGNLREDILDARCSSTPQNGGLNRFGQNHKIGNSAVVCSRDWHEFTASCGASAMGNAT